MKFLHLVLCPCKCPSISQFIVYGNLNRICIPLLCENYINLNYVELIHSAFQVYYILLLFCLFILLIFESLILKLQLKILIYLLKNNCNLQWNFPHSSVGKESACNAGDPGSIPGAGDPLEKGKATHSNILGWRIPWTVQSMGSQNSDTTQQVYHPFG